MHSKPAGASRAFRALGDIFFIGQSVSFEDVEPHWSEVRCPQLLQDVGMHASYSHLSWIQVALAIAGHLSDRYYLILGSRQVAPCLKRLVRNA